MNLITENKQNNIFKIILFQNYFFYNANKNIFIYSEKG